MTDTRLEEIERPKMLLKAAEAGQATYQRRRDLRRMLRIAIPASPADALAKLIPIEAALEERRRTRATSYSLLRHVDVLIALLAEARAIRRPV